ncbi:MAG: SdrD B-like domain-containing protein [Gammaproteobacteria bacterium]
MLFNRVLKIIRPRSLAMLCLLFGMNAAILQTAQANAPVESNAPGIEVTSGLILIVSNHLSFQGEVYFSTLVKLPSGNFANRLWAYDKGNSRLVKESQISGGVTYLNSIRHLTVAGNYLYFVEGNALWKTDGTNVSFIGIPGSSTLTRGAGADYLTAVGDTLYFRVVYSSGQSELWKTDVTSGLVIVKQLSVPNLAFSYQYDFDEYAVLGDTLFFVADDINFRRELWKIEDGSDPVLVKDIYRNRGSSDPESLTIMKDLVYFTAYNRSTGTRLWRSDGTTSGTFIVNKGADWEGGRILTKINDELYFTATFAGQRAVWKTDGTSAGIVQDRVLTDARFEGDLQNPVGINNTVYYVHNSRRNELWKTDGTITGTVLVKVTPHNILNFVPVGNKLFFTTDRPSSQQYPLEIDIWETDGTASGTRIVSDSNVHFSYVSGVGEHLLYRTGLYPQYSVWIHSVDATAAASTELGDFVWDDSNANGIQDSNETGLSNVTIELQTCDGSYLGTTVTNATGGYSFSNLIPGQYRMKFMLLQNSIFSPEKAAGNYRLDSNVNVVTGLTQCYTMVKDQQRLAIDVGMVPDTSTGGNPSMTLAISANGNSTVKPGPVLAEGAAVNWMYSISNTGGTVLNNVIVRGRQKVPVFGDWATLCSIGTIQPGTTGSCSTTDAAAVSGNYLSLIVAKAASNDGTNLENIVKVFYTGEADTPPVADTITLKNAIYFSATKKLWIRAQSDANPAGSANITATVKINGVETALGRIGWKVNKGFYQQVFFDIDTAPDEITLSSDQGGTVTSAIEVR